MGSPLVVHPVDMVLTTAQKKDLPAHHMVVQITAQRMGLLPRPHRTTEKDHLIASHHHTTDLARIKAPLPLQLKTTRKDQGPHFTREKTTMDALQCISACHHATG